jgi:hypothetical protein
MRHVLQLTNRIGMHASCLYIKPTGTLLVLLHTQRAAALLAHNLSELALHVHSAERAEGAEDEGAEDEGVEEVWRGWRGVLEMLDAHEQSESESDEPMLYGSAVLQFAANTSRTQSAHGDVTLRLRNASVRVALESMQSGWYIAAVDAYTSIVAAGTVVEILACLQQIAHAHSNASLGKVSALGLAMVALLDSYLCLAHFTAALLADATFSSFISVAMLKFVLFSFLEVRYMLVTWRIQNAQSFAERDLRQRLSNRYAAFCMFRFVSLRFASNGN